MAWRRAMKQLLDGAPAKDVWQELATKSSSAAKAHKRVNKLMYDADKIKDQVWLGKTTAAKSAAVSFMITSDMRQQLADLGYTQQQVHCLKPEDAHIIVEKNLSPGGLEVWQEQQAALAEEEAAKAQAAAAAEQEAADNETAAAASATPLDIEEPAAEAEAEAETETETEPQQRKARTARLVRAARPAADGDGDSTAASSSSAASSSTAVVLQPQPASDDSDKPS